MLTAKIGDSIINCFDGKYDRYRLKQWSNKGILKCPVCGGDYEYCHGEVVSPYFRHIGKECDGFYGESETDEHRNGKLMLYNWIKDQQGITNCKIEAWIPETKQRPDIYFEFEGKPFVIEFQCTPIASEFLIRRELYKLAGINDIWVLGLQKYKLNESRFRVIEKELSLVDKLIYFDITNKNVIVNLNLIKKNSDILHTEKIWFNNYFCESNKIINYYKNYNRFYNNNIDNFIFDTELKINMDTLSYLTSLEEKFKKDYEMKIEQERLIEEYKKEQISNTERAIEKIKLKLDQENIPYKLQFKNKNRKSNYYNCSVSFSIFENDYVFFIKEKSIDFCEKIFNYKNICTLEKDCISENDIEKFLNEQIFIIIKGEKLSIEKKRIEKIKKDNKYKNIFGEFLNAEIILIHQGKQEIQNDVKFKFLKGFNIFDEYMENIFIKELRFLNKKNVDKYIFMIPKYHSYYNNYGFYGYIKVGEFKNVIIDHFKSYGFTNIKFID
jgi:hypothetical protein